MQSLPISDFQKVIQDEKVIIMFHKPHCSNCEKMLPQFQELSEGRPDIKVYEVLVDEKDNEVMKFFSTKILRKFPPDSQFPYVLSLSKSHIIAWLFSVFNAELLTHAFIEEENLKNTLGEMQIAFDDVEEQHKKLVKELRREEALVKAIIKRKRALTNPDIADEWWVKEEEDFELPTPTIDEKDKVSCWACQ